MDPVTSVSAATDTKTTDQTAAAALGQAAGPGSLDYEAFLKLLVTQMQNQDPLNPMDDTEYVAQLATFSNVEQNIITNQRLEAVLTAQALGDAGALIGRTVTVPEGQSGVVQQVQITSSRDDRGAGGRLGNHAGRRRDDQLMTEVDAIDIVQKAIFTVLIASSPVVAVAMVVGVVISLLQALTQVQEMTLTFIPKIIAILVVAALSASFIGAHIYAMTEEVYTRIATGF